MPVTGELDRADVMLQEVRRRLDEQQASISQARSSVNMIVQAALIGFPILAAAALKSGARVTWPVVTAVTAFAVTLGAAFFVLKGVTLRTSITLSPLLDDTEWSNLASRDWTEAFLRERNDAADGHEKILKQIWRTVRLSTFSAAVSVVAWTYLLWRNNR